MCKCEFYDDSIELTFLRLFCFMLIFWVCTYDFILDIRGQKYSLAGQINIIWIIIIKIILFGYVLRTMFSEQTYPVECGNSLYFCKKYRHWRRKYRFRYIAFPKSIDFRLSVCAKLSYTQYRVQIFFLLQCHTNGI